MLFGGTATSVAFTFSDALKCSGVSGVTSGRFKASGTAGSNDCAALVNEGFPPVSGTITWKGAQHYTSSKVAFPMPASRSPARMSASIFRQRVPTRHREDLWLLFRPARHCRLGGRPVCSALASGCYSSTGLAGLTFTGVAGASVLDVSPPTTVSPPPPVANGPVSVGVDAGSPGVAINEGLIGVNHVVAGSQAALAAIGTEWGRTDVSFEASVNGVPVYNCTTGVWDPSYLDQHVVLDQQAGVTPELIVDYFPSCLADRSSSKERQQWKQLVYQMALHEITAEGVRIFEVWNEPSFTMPLKGTNGYLKLYGDTATELEKAASVAHVSIEVGGPAVDEVGSIDNTWLVALASYVTEHDLPLDFLSWTTIPQQPR